MLNTSNQPWKAQQEGNTKFTKHMTVFANLGSHDAIWGGIPQDNPDFLQPVPATHPSPGFNSSHAHFSFDHPNFWISFSGYVCNSTLQFNKACSIYQALGIPSRHFQPLQIVCIYEIPPLRTNDGQFRLLGLMSFHSKSVLKGPFSRTLHWFLTHGLVSHFPWIWYLSFFSVLASLCQLMTVALW